MIKTATVGLFFLASTLLFRAANGTLGLRSLNIVSVTYYMFQVMIYLGTSLAYLGFLGEHYLIAKVHEEVIVSTYGLVAATGIAIPLIIILVNVLFQSFPVGKSFMAKEREPFYNNLDPQWLVTVIAFGLCVCAASIVYTFAMIGHIPLLDQLLGSSSSAGATRMDATRNFQGVDAVRNLGMIVLTPLVSFLAQIAYRAYGGRVLRNEFICAVVLSIIALTYNLEKSPIVYYLFFSFIVEQLCGRRFSLKWIGLVGICLIGLIILAYYVTSGTGALVLSLENGPLSRLVTTTSAVLMLHIQAFPDSLAFLDGQSLPSGIISLFGIEGGWVRSGRVIMELYNPSAVAAGIAGVMNALFIGEAYANWGMGGVAASWCVVGVFIGVANNLFLRMRKTVLSTLLCIIFIKFNTMTLIGGFVDYLYSTALIFSLIVVVAVYFVCSAPTARSYICFAYHQEPSRTAPDGTTRTPALRARI